jgi:hypothetical protein
MPDRWGKTAPTVFIKRRNAPPDLENSRTLALPVREFLSGINPSEINLCLMGFEPRSAAYPAALQREKKHITS